MFSGYGKLVLPMLRYLLAAAALLLTLAPAQTLDTQKIDAAVEKSMRIWGVPGAAVAIVHGDEMVFAKGYGVRELGREERISAKTVFAIGSITKGFTAAAIATLIEDGKMSWDAGAEAYRFFPSV